MIESFPSAWTVLARAIGERRPVQVRYHGRERILCPHALGWKNGRAQVLSFQAAGSTSDGPLPPDPRQCWRLMFVDEIETPVITDGPWLTADNYLQNSHGLDAVEVEISQENLK